MVICCHVNCRDLRLSSRRSSTSPSRFRITPQVPPAQRLRGKRIEAKAIEEAAAAVADGVEVTENLNGSKEYRAWLARVYVARAIHAAR